MTPHAAVRAFIDGEISQSQLRKAMVGQKGELATDVRSFCRGGRHPGPCDFSLTGGGCTKHVLTYRMRLERMKKAAGLVVYAFPRLLDVDLQDPDWPAKYDKAAAKIHPEAV